jgi:translation initiation factor 1
VKRKSEKNSTLVYSSETGRVCPGCGKPEGQCVCAARKGAPAAPGGPVRVMRQTKGRKGKGVTLVTGLPLDRAGLEALAKELKQRLGAGGAVKDGVIEIQGEHRELLVEELKKRGYAAKAAGG